jgi:hypothetical protein
MVGIIWIHGFGRTAGDEGVAGEGLGLRFDIERVAELGSGRDWTPTTGAVAPVWELFIVGFGWLIGLCDV